MSWDEGATLMEEILEILTEPLEDNQKKVIYPELIALFHQYGCRTLDTIENVDPLYDEAIADYYDGDNDDSPEEI